jgi:hypothetical protein
MPRIEMTPMAKAALLFLRIYLIGIIVLILVKFLRLLG